MAADVKQAVSDLHDAILKFRKQCGDDPDCQRIVTCADACEREIEDAYPAEEDREKPSDKDEPDDEYRRPAAKAREDQPRSMKGATDEVRKQLRSKR